MKIKIDIVIPQSKKVDCTGYEQKGGSYRSGLDDQSASELEDRRTVRDSKQQSRDRSEFLPLALCGQDSQQRGLLDGQ